MLGCVQSDLLYESAGVWLLLWGLAGFFVMRIDKARAIGGKWRIPEASLFIVALAGGAIGMVIGSGVFHHKTSKLSFLVVLYTVLAAWLFFLDQTGFLGCLSTYLPR